MCCDEMMFSDEANHWWCQLVCVGSWTHVSWRENQWAILSRCLAARRPPSGHSTILRLRRFGKTAHRHTELLRPLSFWSARHQTLFLPIVLIATQWITKYGVLQERVYNKKFRDTGELLEPIIEWWARLDQFIIWLCRQAMAHSTSDVCENHRRVLRAETVKI